MTADALPSGASGLAIEVVREAEGWPDEPELEDIADRSVAAARAAGGIDLVPGAGVAILFADDARVRELNAEFRDQDKPTNVLSFPAAEDGFGGEAPHLGDIVLAFETVAAEAEEGGKPLDHHVAHLVMHGFLHLLGYDHIEDQDAERMEQVERVALAGLGIADPYADEGA